MNFLLNFLRQRAPKAGKDMPAYYRRALLANEILLAAYFALTCVMFSIGMRRFEWVPLAMAAALAACRLSIGRINVRAATYAYSLVVVAWCAWHSATVGWSYGAQHLLIPMLMLFFFNIYEPPWVKLLAFLAVVTYRMCLFSLSFWYDGSYTGMSRGLLIAYQTVNSLTLFTILAVDFIVFSSSIQDTERQLRLMNQELHKEADTDPLTGLPNRRAILDVMEAFKAAEPDGQFSLAIADIDFFKKVNDTYGHNCGDYTLVQLADLFRRHAEGKFQVCRWGGEEFCFFLPGLNLDQAAQEMFDIHHAVRQMNLHFGDVDFHITITIGVSENDFQSPMDTLLEQADQKLYQGKLDGRDRVVF